MEVKVEPTTSTNKREPRAKAKRESLNISKVPKVVTPQPIIDNVRSFDFSDTPADSIRLGSNDENEANQNDSVSSAPGLVDVSTPKKPPNPKLKSPLLDSKLKFLLGEEGYNQPIEFLWDEKWLSAKVISPPKTTLSSQIDTLKNIYIHFNGWNKSFDQWVPLDPKVLRYVVKNESLKFDFNVGESAMGRWSDSTFYPCHIVKHQNNGYLVEFYDGFRRPLRPSQVKPITKGDEQKAREIAEENYSPAPAVPKKRKSLYKREEKNDVALVENDNITKRTRLEGNQKDSVSVSSSPAHNHIASSPTRPTAPRNLHPTKKAMNSPTVNELAERDTPGRSTRRRSTRNMAAEKVQATITTNLMEENVPSPKPSKLLERVSKWPPDKESASPPHDASKTTRLVYNTKTALTNDAPMVSLVSSKPTSIAASPSPDHHATAILAKEQERVRVEKEEQEMAAKAREIEAKQRELAAKKIKIERELDEQRIRKVESEQRERDEEAQRKRKEEEHRRKNANQIDMTGLSDREKEIIMTMEEHSVPTEVIQTAIDKIRIDQKSIKKDPVCKVEDESVHDELLPKNDEVAPHALRENPNLLRTRRLSVLRSSPRSSPKQQSDSAVSSPSRKRPLSNAPSSPSSSTSSTSRLSESNGRRETGDARRLRNRSQTRDDDASEPDEEKNDINYNAHIHNKGDLVWALWKDTKPYGAIILDVVDTSYTVRYADGVEATIKHEMVTSSWRPETTLEEDFLKFFERLYKHSDPKLIQKSLKLAKSAFEKAKSESVFRLAAPFSSDGGPADVKTKAETSSNAIGITKTTKQTPVIIKKITKGKTLQSLTDKLTEKANSSVRPENVPIVEQKQESRSRPPRKSKPMRRKSETGTEPRIDPITMAENLIAVENDEPRSPRRTRRLTQEQADIERDTEPSKSLKMMPKTIKESYQNAQLTIDAKDAQDSEPVKMMPKSVKEIVVGKINVEKSTPTKHSDKQNELDDDILTSTEVKITPIRKSLRPSSSIEKAATEYYDQKMEKKVDVKSPSSRISRATSETDDKRKEKKIDAVVTVRKSTRPFIDSDDRKVDKKSDLKTTPIRKSTRSRTTSEVDDQKTDKSDGKTPPTRKLTRPSTSRFAVNSPSRSPATGQTPKRSPKMSPRRSPKRLEAEIPNIIRTRRSSVLRQSPQYNSSHEDADETYLSTNEGNNLSVLDLISSDSDVAGKGFDAHKERQTSEEPPAKRPKRRSSRSSQSSDIELKSIASSINVDMASRELTPNSPRIVLERITMTPPIPKYSTGDHILISTGKPATILKPSIYRNGQWEYFIKVDHGPKIKETQQNISLLPTNDVVSPIISEVITQSVKKGVRRVAERKKSESVGTGWAYEIKTNVKPPKAFACVDKEFRCQIKTCNKSFRKQTGLEAHMKHYHPDVIIDPPFSPQTICLESRNSASPSDVGSSLAGTRDNSSASENEREEEILQTQKVYQCSCGWEGEQFWTETSQGVPMRTHICQRPRAARNLKNTHLLKELGRTVDTADYFDGFKQGLYKDDATQE